MTTKLREKFLLIMISSLTTLALTLPFLSLSVNTKSDSKTSDDILLFGLIDTAVVAIIIVVISIFYINKSKDNSDSIAPEIIEHYDEIRKKHEQQKFARLQEMTNLVSDYIHHTLSPYLTESDVLIVCDNMKLWLNDEGSQLRAVATDGRLTSLDIRHFVWNIGERLKWNGHKRALFAKMVFPMEMKDIEVNTIRRNLRHRGTCTIDLDTPEKGELRFSFQLTSD